MQLTNNLRTYVTTQLNTMSKNTPIIGFMKPLITRALDKNFNKVTGFLDLIANDEGKVDIENILAEMMDGVLNTEPFIFKTSFIGDVEIGGGQIKFNLPFTNKRLMLDITDLEAFKEMLITKE